MAPPAIAASNVPTPGDLSPHPLAQGVLDKLRWQARPLVIVADGPAIETQLTALMQEADALSERDVVILTAAPGTSDLPLPAGGDFALLLIGKDGGVKLSRSQPVTPAEIIALIDQMPMRQNEAQR
ncbi:DUF4174 domain-containing protein [Paracoccus bogoriensis]|nr:DUF4174 domain-containing protein [Paracoccus bogoriensis]